MKTQTAKKAIALRQLRLSLIVAAVIGFTYGCIQLYFDWNDQHNRIATEVETLVDGVSRSAGTALWNLDENLAVSILQGLSGHSFISSSKIQTNAGTVLASVEGEGPKNTGTALSRYLFFDPFERKFQLTVQDDGSDVYVGDLFVKVTPYHAHQQLLRRATITMLGGLVKAGFLSLALYWLFVWTTSRPLSSLMEQVLRIDPITNRGSVIHAPIGHANDELGAIASAFNQQMQKLGEAVSELETKETELRKINKELDSRVAERTQELRTAVEEAKRLANVRAGFLANMSHELRTPLNAIIGFSDAAIQTPPGKSTDHFKEYFEYIHGAGTNLHTMVNELLDLSRIDSDRLVVDLKEVDIVNLAGEVYDTLSPIISARGNAGIVESEFDAYTLSMDPNLFRQVLINLIGNAAKYTENGKITLSLGIAPNSPESFLVEVKDTGIGIEPKTVPKIFDPFVLGETQISGDRHSSGLGLSIVKRICERLSWEIRVKTELGMGSTFSILIPIPNSSV